MPPLELAARMLYWFFVYGLLGWCLEVMFAAVKERRLVNRGFLCGPICPIYGFGMVALLLAVRALGDPGGLAGAAVTFVTGMVLATLVELVAGWVLFQLYHIRWWDYSHLKGNIGGYICPQFSLLWGLGSVVMVHAVHPLLAGPGNALPLRALLVENPAWDALLDWLGRWISFSDLLAVPVLFVLILLMYTFMPGGKRPLRPQVPGTVFTTAGWVVFSRAFSFYIVHFWRLSYIYGSLTAIVLMILWLDIIINLFFLGAALNAALARKID